MRAHGVEVPPPVFDNDLGLGEGKKISPSTSSSRSLALNGSMKPFIHGLPGAM